MDEDKETLLETIDILQFYTTDEMMGEHFLEVAGKLFTYALSFVKERGINIVYGTCTRKLKAMYSLMGWKVIDKKDVNGFKKLLLRYDL